MEKPRRGIQSVEIGTQLLIALSRQVTPMALREVAKAAGITVGKAHPYLVSYLKLGFVVQDAAGRYELGPLALQLGLARLQRLDPIKEASPFIEALAAQTQQSIGVAVWGNFGATVVRLEEPVQPMHVNLRTGTVMSLTYTATGRLFAAYLPPKVVERLIDEDLSRQGGTTGHPLLTRAQVNAYLAETREHGLSRSLGQPIPGIDALSAPVFDADGHIVLAITAMGPQASFDSAWDGRIAVPLKRCAEQISARLGFSGA
ncbi:IclR family transcriptional regulator [Caldimonas sp.]|uniref:IclR family transcriptional regulator n=1 Tax=Caldimonas sp. TaxID=2838790 RepID=UPI00391E026B